MELFDSLKFKIVRRGIRIAFPEASDTRILGAVARLKGEELIEPVLIGKQHEIEKAAATRGINITNMTIYDPDNCGRWDQIVDAFVERRNGKVTREQAEELLKDENYFGTMLTYMGITDGLVSGAIHSTGDTVRPALQIIKTKPGISRTSGAFLMMRGNEQEKYIFSDCAINVAPSPQELAEIAIASAHTAEMFDIQPRVAMLSFSTKGSAKAPQADATIEATKIAKELAPELAIDGELQFDAAYIQSVAQLKAPESDVAGKASVFVFPDLQSGNIGYKIAQRFGNFEAIGPILQGLNKPVSDLSRGCNEEDVYKLSIITAAQSLMS
ncbi:phosphate acetyltransferase [Enterococcus saccharolyticus]|uniref:Phosphate acetyltransferase n=1 Tax=Enterococcus saccharolyticus subsp. saccharolyticus ATCC 43076 TaxID=1139996 RepID=S0NWD3_9ENTE|nr:phosphate acetyltransferase [Enterococcus saccharolyticus]EOT29960.1 phosphate acetyltransferase [Enterococcus saccharolyticus subsp. saccharolyticus ATCC 43076]EOT80506.1 phosphate acetyltransferase [Enterococcus saccharolyticus subsp. saccharolyticus ATCC 43076]OJG90047.1 phosphate acetyltransferase [Enterococcus saccharolyticus]